MSHGVVLTGGLADIQPAVQTGSGAGAATVDFGRVCKGFDIWNKTGGAITVTWDGITDTAGVARSSATANDIPVAAGASLHRDVRCSKVFLKGAASLPVNDTTQASVIVLGIAGVIH